MGTGWLPDEAPMYGYMKHKGDWMYMLHGNLFIRYNKQDLLDKGSRGDAKIDAPNWAMLMGQRPVGKKGLFHFNVMASLDPLIAGGEGYPLLFQTGETWNDVPLVDRQHPHDLLSELSVSYAHALSPKADVFVYAGYPGEPALGPLYLGLLLSLCAASITLGGVASHASGTSVVRWITDKGDSGVAEGTSK